MQDTEKIIREPERRDTTGIPKATWRRYERSGLVPKRVRIGPRAVGWRLSEIKEWIESREAVGEN